VRRIVKVHDKEVKLSPKEHDLLRVLVQHAGKVLTHKFLLGELWDDLTDTQYLRVYVRQLRQKIEAEPTDVATAPVRQGQLQLPPRGVLQWFRLE
jgi:two-component system, OmpR family, KDP operon response regulator KdpE